MKHILRTAVIISLAICAHAEEGKPLVFLGEPLPPRLHHEDAYSIRDIFIEDVPGTKSYWIGPWVETVEVQGINRFYIIKGYNRFYVNAAFLSDTRIEFLSRSTGTYDFYGPFTGKPDDHFKIPAEQGSGGNG